ncbi:phage tail protein [Pseudomonas lurida]|uniref:phage tail protein n=1 Tax=Pseudomonas lurida TaxID=244566 RepID=UPI000A9BD7FA|nr:phage tail protein [Pseudomonas lurida]
MVDKNSIFGGMITTLGAAKKTNCDALGVPWEPRYMLIGDANGADPVPSPTQTKLINQVYRAQLNQLRVSPTDANVLIAEVVLPPDVGGWHIRELALEDKDGVFSAVANVPPSYKPLLAQGSGRNQVVRMHIITSGTSNIQLKIDPSVVLATRQYVDEAVSGLLPASKVAGTYTKVKVDARGVFVSGSNPTTLEGYGITDAFTKEQGEALVTQATEKKLGTAKIATQDQVQQGVVDDVIVTPKKMRWGFSFSFGVNSYITFPFWLGSWIVQYGKATANTPNGRLVTFPLEFPNACRFACPGEVSNPGTGAEYVQMITTDKTGISGVTYTNVAGPTVGGLTFGWLAIGD